MNNLSTRDCGIPDFKLLKERVYVEVEVKEDEEGLKSGAEAEGIKETIESENVEVRKDGGEQEGSTKMKTVAVLVESDRKMKQLKAEILSKIPSSGVILIFREDRQTDALVSFRKIQSDWELKRVVGRLKIGEEGLFEHMRGRLIAGDAKRFVFFYAPV